MDTSQSVGPYELGPLIATGGMAHVYEATDERGARLALKILPHEGPRHAALIRAFRSEVRAAACLHHPHIVQVLDAGFLAPEEARGELCPGAPWVVMPRGSPLLESVPSLWDDVRGLLEAVLAGLAHAHARGLLHRDVKPGNVLRVCTRWMLGDFGLVYDLRADEGTPLRGGTPGFMAPEQARGDLAAQGPWTDLYAVGRMATWLVVDADGQPELPAWPAGLDRWIGELTEPNPASRVRHAADARAGLHALGPAVLDAALPAPDGAQSHASSSAAHTQAGWLGDGPVPDLPPRSALTIAAVCPAQRPPQPETQGTRSGLFGVRQPPLVGREQVRDRLWHHLWEASSARRPVAVVLRGSSGVGKSRVAAWWMHEAAESGAVEPFHVRHGPLFEVGSGLHALVARAVRCDGITDAAGLRDHVERLELDVDPELLAALLLEPLHGRLGAPRTRYAFVRRALDGVARGRLPFLWLDDAQWDPESIQFAHAALESGWPCVLALAVQDEALAERTWESSLMEALEAHDLCHVVELGPFSAEEAAAFAGTLADVPPAEAVALARGESRPVAIHLRVAEWLEHGDVPRDIDLQGLWRNRIERALLSAPASAELALAVAATLGVHVERGSWAGTLDTLDTELTDEIIEALLDAGLIRRWRGAEGEVYELAHFTLRAVLLGDLDEARRWELHAACADALPDSAAHLEARMRHNLAAGRYDAADRDFCRACDCTIQTDVRRAEALCLWFEEVIRARAGPDHPGITSALCHRARLSMFLGRGDRGVDLGKAAVKRARSARDSVREAAACGWIGLSLQDDDPAEARAWLERAIQVGPERGFPGLWSPGIVRVNLARMKLVTGDVWGAKALLERSTLTYPSGVAYVRLHLVEIYDMLGEAEAAHRELQALFDGADPGASILSIGHQLRARMALGRGDYASAEQDLQLALGLRNQIGYTSPSTLSDLSHLRWLQGRADDARAVLQRSLDSGSCEGQIIARLVLAVGSGDGTEARAVLDELEALAPAMILPRRYLFPHAADAARRAHLDDVADRARALGALVIPPPADGS